MWLVAYLAFNGVAYLLLGLWCAMSVDRAAASIGFKILDASGRCEFTAVYGGLQVALGAAFLAAAWINDFRRIGLLFAVLLYASVMLFRVIGLLRHGPVAPLTRGVAVIEASMLAAGVALMIMLA